MALGLAETLEKEVSRLGIRTVVFDAGGFETAQRASQEGEQATDTTTLPDYEDLMGSLMQGFMADILPNRPGDVERFSQTVIDVLKGEGLAKGRKWPIRVALGPDSLAVVRQKCHEQLELSEIWEDAASSVNRDDWSGVISTYLMETCSMLGR